MFCCRFFVGISVLVLVVGCGGDEFSGDASGGAAGSGAGGSAGSGAAAGSGGVAASGGSAGNSGAAGSSAGAGGQAGGGAGGTAGGAGGAPPVGCGPVAGIKPLLFTTLDDAQSILSPKEGSGAGSFQTLPEEDFRPGKCGKAIRLDAKGENVQFDEKSNLEVKKGTIDFWYQPELPHTDGVLRNFFSSPGYWTKANGLLIRKTGGGLGNAFQVAFRDKAGGNRTTEIDSSAYTFSSNTWVRITVTWDFSLSGQAVRVYFDGVEAKYKSSVNGTSEIDSHQVGRVRIGNPDSAQSPVGGLIDDFKIYDRVVKP